MALSDFERQIAERGKELGKSKEEVLKAIQKHRAKQQAAPAPVAPKPKAPELLSKATASVAPQGFLDKLGGAAKAGSEFGLGVLKGGLSTISGASELGQKGLRSLTGLGGLKPKIANIEDVTGVKDIAKPIGPAQEAGFAAEQIGEFFGASAAMAPALKAVGAAAKGTQAAKFLSKAPDAVKAAGSVGKAALKGAAEFAPVSAIQTGSGAGGLEGAAIGAAFGGVGKAAGKTIATIFPKKVNRAIGALKKDFRFGKNPGKQIVDEGIFASNIQSLSKQVNARTQQVGAQIGQLTKNIKGKVDMKKPLKIINQEAERVLASSQTGKTQLASQLLKMQDDLAKEFKIVGGKVVETGQKKMILTPAEALRAKVELAKGTKWTGAAFDKDINQVRVRVYKAIREEIEKAATGPQRAALRGLNERFANLITAQSAVARALDKSQVAKSLGVGFGAGAAGIGAGTTVGVARGVLAEDPAAGLAEGFKTAALVGLGTKALGSTAVSTGGPFIGRAIEKGLPALGRVLAQQAGSERRKNADFKKREALKKQLKNQ